MTSRAPLMACAALAVVLIAGCGSSTKQETTTTATPPPEAMRPSPVDRDAEPAPAMFDWTHHVGVAGHDAAGHVVVALKDDSLAVGTALTIVWMTEPQRISDARIVGRRAHAWEVARTPIDGRAYDVAITGRGSDDYGIAVVSSRAPEAGKGSLVRIDLDGDGEAETFRQCASSEGLHLTVWTGEPLKGPLDWQGYVYLGMDLEVTCTETETGQP